MTYEVKDIFISLDDVCLNYGDVPVLRHVSAEVRDIVRPGFITGQVVGILGPSGVGKTQLSRVMSGLQAPTSGSVNIHDGGKKIAVEPGLVGVVAQNYPLLRHRTVLGNLVTACVQTGKFTREAAKEKSLMMLHQFELGDKANEYPAHLSGGQRQRVAILQQLLCSEHYIIMDEPFTGLDPIMKDKTCDLISQVASLDERNTIFVVAHDIPAVVTICDTLWLIGRDRNESGKSLGARIQATYDLAAMGFAWHPELASTPQFAYLVAELKEKFKTL